MSPQLPEVGFMSDLLLYVVIIINIYTWEKHAYFLEVADDEP
jgi:hypothetical protein